MPDVFYGKRRPDPDEVVLRATVHGTCNSRKCNGAFRSATKTVYGNGDILYRCVTCKTPNEFIEDTSAGRDPSRPGRNDYDDDFHKGDPKADKGKYTKYRK